MGRAGARGGAGANGSTPGRSGEGRTGKSGRCEGSGEGASDRGPAARGSARPVMGTSGESRKGSAATGVFGTSQSRIVPSVLPAATDLPSGENATEEIPRVGPSRSATTSRESTRRSRIAKSPRPGAVATPTDPAEARSRPSGEKARAVTAPDPRGWRVAVTLEVRTSRRRIVPSRAPVARASPSGENAAQVTGLSIRKP